MWDLWGLMLLLWHRVDSTFVGKATLLFPGWMLYHPSILDSCNYNPAEHVSRERRLLIPTDTFQVILVQMARNFGLEGKTSAEGYLE